MIKITDNIFSLIFHALFLFVALSLLYVFIISKMETQAFKDEIGSQIVNNLPQQLAKQDKGKKLKLVLNSSSNSLDKLDKYYDQQTKETIAYNNGLKNMMVLIVIIFILSITLPYLFLRFTCNYKVPLGSIILENIILFIFIGLFEVFFFLKIARKYIPTPPSKLINKIIDNLNK